MYQRNLVPTRRTTAWALCAALGLGVTACGQNTVEQTVGSDEQVVPAEMDFEVIGTPAAPGERPHSIYIDTMREQYAPQHFTPHGVMAQVPRIIYLNHNGATLTAGYSDSVNDVSSLVNSTTQYPAWNVSSSQWNQVVNCVKDLYAPFDITVTDTDPGNVDHIKAMVGGYPQDVGFQQGVGGVSPFSCGIIDRSIVFIFAEVYQGDLRGVCETVAQETAHSYGLDHEHLCEDPMTYLYGCGNKTFQDVDAQCGEYSARTCQCGGSTQNSVQMIMAASGPAGPGDAIAPNVSITQPANNATVEPGFAVRANASDNVQVTQVQLFVDGNLAATKTSAPWSFTTDSGLADGSHSIKVRASDGTNTSDASINVTVNPTSNPPPNDPPPNDPPPDPNDPNNPGDPPPNDTPPGDTQPGDSAPLVGGCSSTSGTGGLPQAFALLLMIGLIARRRESE